MEQLREDDLAVLRGGRGDATSVCTPAINKDYPPAMYRVKKSEPNNLPNDSLISITSGQVYDDRVVKAAGYD